MLYKKSLKCDTGQFACGVFFDSQAFDTVNYPVLGPLLFVLFINDFHKVIEISSIHHFADRNLLLIDKSLKTINKHINRDLKLSVDWIRANQLSLNASKTETVLFKPRIKKITLVVKTLSKQVKFDI